MTWLFMGLAWFAGYYCGALIDNRRLRKRIESLRTRQDAEMARALAERAELVALRNRLLGEPEDTTDRRAN